MSVQLYDNAVKDKISNWVKDPNMKILGPEETEQLFEIASDKANDKPIALPMITITRDDDIDFEITGKNPKSFDGFKILQLDDKAVKITAIPMHLMYNIDIYTKTSDVAYEYLRNFYFNLINHPNVDIVIPYNDVNYPLRSHLEVSTRVKDNSNIPQRRFPGQFKRLTISFVIDDAYLYNAPIKDNVHICDVDQEIIINE